jgi:Rho-binding antiterminator
MEPCHNSIKPRAGRELWLCAVNEPAYEPIDCDLYDRYEAAATLRQRVRLTFVDGSASEGIIHDLFVRDKIEWLRMDDGSEARLDAVRKFQVLAPK